MTPPKAIVRAMTAVRNIVRLFSHLTAQLDQVTQSAQAYQKPLTAAGYGKITTEMSLAGEFYYAETYHQQYLHKVPHGYCGLQGTAWPIRIKRHFVAGGWRGRRMPCKKTMIGH